MWQSDSGSFNSQLVGVYVYVYILTRKNVFNMLAVFIQFICPKCQSTHVAHEHFNGIYSLFIVGTSRTLHTQHTKYNFWSSLEHGFYSFISKFLYFFFDEMKTKRTRRQNREIHSQCLQVFNADVGFFHSIQFRLVSFHFVDCNCVISHMKILKVMPFDCQLPQ